MIQPVEIPVDFTLLNQTPVENCKFIQALRVGDTNDPKEVFIINSATAVPRKFYLNFAIWLAKQRQAFVYVYDYTGFGKSATESLKNYDVDMLDWGLRDVSSVLDYVVEHHPHSRIVEIGHSLGGLMLHYLKNSERIDRIITVASGAGYTKKTTMPYRLFVYFFWYVMGPLLISVFGYVAASKINFGVDIPRRVFWQWRFWCKSLSFYKLEFGDTLDPLINTKANPKMICFCVTDDPVVNEDTVKAMPMLYRNSSITPIIKKIHPPDYGIPHMGHLNFFKKSSQAAWPLLLKEL